MGDLDWLSRRVVAQVRTKLSESSEADADQAQALVDEFSRDLPDELSSRLVDVAAAGSFWLTRLDPEGILVLTCEPPGEVAWSVYRDADGATVVVTDDGIATRYRRGATLWVRSRCRQNDFACGVAPS